MRPQWLAATAAVSGLAAVVLAALGAHAIALPDASATRMWDAALEIHYFHTAAMLGIAALAMRMASPAITYSGLILAVGTALFSGSLYLRAAGLDWFPVYLAPAGGLLLMAGWLWLLLALLRKNPD